MVNLRRGTKKSDHPFQIQLQLAQRRKLPKIGEIKLDSPLGYEGNFDNHTIHGQFLKNKEFGHSLGKNKTKRR